jgi:Protein of unknown function (DUF550)
MTLTLEQLALLQIPFSTETFGPGQRRRGLCEHIEKELVEISKAKSASERMAELVDVFLLGLDGAWRNERLWSGDDRQVDAIAKLAANEILEALCHNVATISYHRSIASIRRAGDHSLVSSRFAEVAAKALAHLVSLSSWTDAMIMIKAKIDANKARTWPKPTSQDRAIEHVRGAA